MHTILPYTTLRHGTHLFVHHIRKHLCHFALSAGGRQRPLQFDNKNSNEGVHDLIYSTYIAIKGSTRSVAIEQHTRLSSF